MGMIVTDTKQLEVLVRRNFELRNNTSLLWQNAGSSSSCYPIGRMQKGLLLTHSGKELDEEGTGFGVPVLKLGCETILPGSAKITVDTQDEISIVVVTYILNLVQRIRLKNKLIDSKTVYKLNEYLASIHRNAAVLRGIGTWLSNSFRRIFSMDTVMETISPSPAVTLVYSIHAKEGTVHISTDLSGLNKYEHKEIILTNEQGASYFDRYLDSNALTLTGKAIGSWDETDAEEASFVDSCHNIAFALQKVEGARMFRGREFVAGRLSWAGLAYVVPRNTTQFAYDIRIRPVR